MRAPTRARVRVAVSWSLLLSGSLTLTGCATLRATLDGYQTGSHGISREQQRLRDALARGDFKTALGWHQDDALLRQLDVGIASFYAAQFARSAAVLDTAALLADDRITASVSRDALALMTNDLARPYQPRRTERLFIPYYGMLAYARLEQWEDAAVEARRLVALLAQYADDRDEGERALHASLHRLAGAVFERAGERGDASVAYRAAQALERGLVAPDSAAVPSRAAAAGTGELLVVVERGFVAHLVTRTMEIELGTDDRDSLRLIGSEQGPVHGPASASREGGGLLRKVSAHPELAMPTYNRSRRYHDDDDDDYLLTIAFPALRRSARPWGGTVRLAVDSDTLEHSGVASLVDDARAADEQRTRSAIVTRAVARAAAKYVAVKAVKDKKGEVAGTLANLGAMLLERADVRSWHLLPQELVLIRVRLPAGAHTVRLRIGEGSATRTVEIGTVAVRAGTVSIVPVRVWQSPPPAPVAFADSPQPRP
jgi:hypothetical protein